MPGRSSTKTMWADYFGLIFITSPFFCLFTLWLVHPGRCENLRFLLLRQGVIFRFSCSCFHDLTSESWNIFGDLGPRQARKHFWGNILDFRYFLKSFTICLSLKKLLQWKKLFLSEFRKCFRFQTLIFVSEISFLRLTPRETMLSCWPAFQCIYRTQYPYLYRLWMLLTKYSFV